MTAECPKCRLVPCLCAQEVCSMCYGKGTIMLRRLSGRLEMAVCRRCFGDGKTLVANGGRE